MKWWPFVLRSTHERELAKVREDSARNNPAPAPAPQRPVNLLTTGQMLHLIGEGAAMAASAGCPLFRMMAFRSSLTDLHGAVLAVIAGKISDDDMRRFRAFTSGFAQDAAPAQRTVSYVDRLGTEDPS